MNFVSYAQNFEDVLLWRALGHVERGFYVDVGAQDPMIDSVSLAFYERGWRGVHIEPSPQYAAKLREFRPDETVIEAAVAAAPGTLTFFEVPGTGLGTADCEIAEQHRVAGFEVKQRTVDCQTLTQLLAPFLDRDIHWMKIDVEGLEAEVIAGWDAKRVRPWIVIVEATRPLTEVEAHDEWEPLVLGRGYDFAFFDGLNRYYVSNDRRDLLASFSRPANVFDRFELSGTASNTFTQRLERRISALKDLQGELDAARGARATLEKELTAAQDVIRTLEAANVRLESRLSTLHLELEQATRQVVALDSEVSRLNAHIAWQQYELDAAKADLAATAGRLRARVAEIEGVYHSVSWRLTKPLRLMNRKRRAMQAYPARVMVRIREIAKAPPRERPRHLARWLLQRPRLLALSRAVLWPFPSLRRSLRQYLPTTPVEPVIAPVVAQAIAAGGAELRMSHPGARPMSHHASCVLDDLRTALRR